MLLINLGILLMALSLVVQQSLDSLTDRSSFENIANGVEFDTFTVTSFIKCVFKCLTNVIAQEKQ